MSGSVPQGHKGDFDNDTWRLYNLAEDPSESHDLAAENPGKLPEMQELFDVIAEKYKVYPLDDRESSELIAAKNEALGGEKTDFTFYQGMSPLHQDIAPNTFGNNYRIDVDLNRGNSGSEGVLVAQGGTGGGYTLYIKDDKLVYEYNYLGFERFTINTNTNVPTGKSKVTYDFTQTGNNQNGGYDGIGKLFLNDQPISDPVNIHTVLFTFGVEFFDVVQDSHSPVSEANKPPFTFNDSIEKVSVHIYKPQPE